MNNLINKKLIGFAQSLAIFMSLPGILLTTSCNGSSARDASNNKNAANTQLPEGLPNNLITNEIEVETKLQEALKQIEEEDKRRLEKENLDSGVKNSEKEEKTEDSQPYEKVINVTRHLDLRYFLFNPGLGVLVKTEYGTFVTKNTYVRTKFTKNDGTITYSDWELIRFQEVLISQRQTGHFEKS